MRLVTICTNFCRCKPELIFPLAVTKFMYLFLLQGGQQNGGVPCPYNACVFSPLLLQQVCVIAVSILSIYCISSCCCCCRVGWVQSKLRQLILRLESARFLHATPFPVHHLARARASDDGNASEKVSNADDDMRSGGEGKPHRRKRGRLSLEHNGSELNLSSASSVDAAKEVVDSMIEPGGANGRGANGHSAQSHRKDSKDVSRWKELLRDHKRGGATSGEKRKRSQSIDSTSSQAHRDDVPAATKRPKREFSQSFWIGLDVHLDNEKSSNAPLSVDITTVCCTLVSCSRLNETLPLRRVGDTLIDRKPGHSENEHP